MNDQTTGPDDGPPPSSHDWQQRFDSIDRLRRSATDRYVAGVAGGLGRHFGIDPVIIRVLLVVVTFFGGAGIIAYAAGWLLIPDERTDAAALRTTSEGRRIILLVVLAVAALVIIGEVVGGFVGGVTLGFGGHGLWRLTLIVVAVSVLVALLSGRSTPAPPPPRSGPPFAPPGTTPAGDAGGPGAGVGPHTAAGPYAMAPVAPAQPPGYAARAAADDRPGHPTASGSLSDSRQRGGPAWFWPTLALIAIAVGVLALVDQTWTPVPIGAFSATALGITGLMLILGSIIGRPTGLILLGLITAVILAMTMTFTGVITSLPGMSRAGIGEITRTPLTGTELADGYELLVGEIDLDLTDLDDPTALADRTLALRLGVGSIRVIVPAEAPLDVAATVNVAGEIDLPDRTEGGVFRSVNTRFGDHADGPPPLTLDIAIGVGTITVEQQ